MLVYTLTMNLHIKTYWCYIFIKENAKEISVVTNVLHFDNFW